METIMNENCGEESTKTSENICDASSRLRRKNPPSYSASSSVVLSHRSDKHLFYSLNNISTTKKPSKISTFNSSPLLINQQKSFPQAISHQSIDIIKENFSNQFLYEDNHSNPTTTKIKLTLPIASNGLSHRRRYTHKTQINQNSVQGEFTLPTNPPITVTIQPQNNINQIIQKDNSLHDDQIYSPDHIHFINHQRVSLDTSLKGTSTIVNYFMDLLKPSDNKLAMKLFGSKKGVLKERLRQQRAGHCIIHPCSNFR